MENKMNRQTIQQWMDIKQMMNMRHINDSKTINMWRTDDKETINRRQIDDKYINL